VTALATLAIHAEAWLQEELGAQHALAAVLERIERAARAGSSADLARSAQELEALLGGAPGRDARRRVIGMRAASELGLAAEVPTLAALATRLAAAGVDVARLDALRAELRAAVAAGLRASRRLAALAQYHRGVLEELCQLLLADAPVQGGGHLVDASA
jgi:hypothetical protein